jgi:hypothetical protein
MKDLAPLDGGASTARISVWDSVPELDGALVGEVLKRRPCSDAVAGKAILALAEGRLFEG